MHAFIMNIQYIHVNISSFIQSFILDHARAGAGSHHLFSQHH